MGEGRPTGTSRIFEGERQDMQLFQKEGPFVIISENTHLCMQKLQKDLPQTTVEWTTTG